MRYVDRKIVPAPPYLVSREIQSSRNKLLDYLQLEPDVRRQTRVPFRPLRPNDTVLAALGELFDSKCAFCEGHGSLTLHQFRPPRNAEPGGVRSPELRVYYSWLADVWQNLYPICEGCKPKREGWFPVFGERVKSPSAMEYEAFCASLTAEWPGYPIAEEHVLLDPCGDQDLQAHLVLTRQGHLRAETERGDATIEHFNLNRRDLVRRRKADWGTNSELMFYPEGQTAEFFGLRREPRGGPTGPRREVKTGTFVYKVPLAPHGAEELIVDGSQPTAGTAISYKAPSIAVRAPGLKKVTLRNFKALEAIEIEIPDLPKDPELARSLVILGENAAGKSSILEAIALAALDDRGRKALAEAPRKYLLNPSFMGAQGRKQRTSGSVVLTFDDGSERRISISATEFTPSGTKLTPPVFAYGAYRHFVDTQQDWTPARPVLSLFRSADLLSNPQAWLLSLTKDEFAEVVGVLRVVFGLAQKFDVIEPDYTARVCFVVTDVDENHRRRTPLESVSSGFRTILALCCDLMRWGMKIMQERADFDADFTNFPGILLIDEVEAHLHPRWKIQIMTGLRKAFPSMTIIATTHDPLCLRGMFDGEVKVLRRTYTPWASSTLPTTVEAIVDLPDVSRLTVEQLLTSDLFSLFSTDDEKGEGDIAGLADYLAKLDGSGTQTEEGREAWRKLNEEISGALPIGRGEGARLVQEAVAKYLVKRPSLPKADRDTLREQTVNEIVRALEGLI